MGQLQHYSIIYNL